MPIEQKPHGKWIRERQRAPSSFPKSTKFRTTRSGDHRLVIAVEPSGKTEVQSILHPPSEGIRHVVRAHARRGTRGVRSHSRRSRGRLANFGDKRAAPFRAAGARRRSASRADANAIYVLYREARRKAAESPTAANLAEEKRLHERYVNALEGRQD